MKSRNNFVDIIRGFAMLMVVLGHTLSGSTSEYQNSYLFQMIWTLQMPLFIIISGYVTRYSRPILSFQDLCLFIKKRTLAYILPWFVWTIIVRGLIFNETNFLNIKYLFWHMDSGYWFLVTIWTISIIYGFADYLSHRFSNHLYKSISFHFMFCIFGMILLSVIALFLGWGFFSIKLTLYYLPIFLLGYLYGQIQDNFLSRKKARSFLYFVSSITLVTWVSLITRFDFFAAGDDGIFVILRFCTSVVGCISVISLFYGVYGLKVKELFLWSGIHSLEIYLGHYLFLNMIKNIDLPVLTSLNGFVMLVLNFSLTFVCTSIFIKLIQRNNILNYFLYGKHV